MTTCGQCYHYRQGRCKNRDAATYNRSYPGDSQGCQMSLSRMFLPFGFIFSVIAAIASIIGIIFIDCGNGGSSNGTRSSGGFEI